MGEPGKDTGNVRTRQGEPTAEDLERITATLLCLTPTTPAWD